MATSLADLRTGARYRADMVNSQFVSDAELNTFVNAAYGALYDILVSKFVDYYVMPPVLFTLGTGQSTYPLPADFYKLLGIDQLCSDAWVALAPFSFENRNRRFYPFVLYRMLGSNLVFSPSDQAPGSYQLWYVPRCATLVNDTDSIDVVNGWDEYVMVAAAIKCLAKEESDTSALAAQLAALEQRIDQMAANRDVGECERITDVSHSGIDWRFRGGW